MFIKFHFQFSMQTVLFTNHELLLPNDITSLLKQNILTDAVIYVKDDGVRVHKIILAAASPFFMKMFIDHGHHKNTFEVFDVSIEELKAIVGYIYTGKIEVDWRKFQRFLEVCKYFELKLDFKSRPKSEDDAIFDMPIFKAAVIDENEVELQSQVNSESEDSDMSVYEQAVEYLNESSDGEFQSYSVQLLDSSSSTDESILLDYTTVFARHIAKVQTPVVVIAEQLVNMEVDEEEEEEIAEASSSEHLRDSYLETSYESSKEVESGQLAPHELIFPVEAFASIQVVESVVEQIEDRENSIPEIVNIDYSHENFVDQKTIDEFITSLLEAAGKEDFLNSVADEDKIVDAIIPPSRRISNEFSPPLSSQMTANASHEKLRELENAMHVSSGLIVPPPHRFSDGNSQIAANAEPVQLLVETKAEEEKPRNRIARRILNFSCSPMPIHTGFTASPVEANVEKSNDSEQTVVEYVEIVESTEAHDDQMDPTPLPVDPLEVENIAPAVISVERPKLKAVHRNRYEAGKRKHSPITSFTSSNGKKFKPYQSSVIEQSQLLEETVQQGRPIPNISSGDSSTVPATDPAKFPFNNLKRKGKMNYHGFNKARKLLFVE